MSMKLVSQFQLLGQLQEWVVKDGDRVKYLWLQVGNESYRLKLAKEIRYCLNPQLKPGCWLEVSGIQSEKIKTGEIKRKIDNIRLVDPPAGDITQPAPPETAPAKKSRACVLVCSKSNCWHKQGGQAVAQALEASLAEQGLAEQVALKLTGCLKECEKGPNIIMMPDKARYSRVRPREIPALIAEHFVSAIANAPTPEPSPAYNGE